MTDSDDLFIGLMSGTSADGVDGVLVAWPHAQNPRILAHVHEAFTAGLRELLLNLNQPGPNELARAAFAGSAVARVYADVTHALLGAARMEASQVHAIGAHGQTVRHRPGPLDMGQSNDLIDPVGYTIQLLNGALLAELTGIDVVCDLRSGDVAAGGQGAPLVPAVHRVLFSRNDADVAVLNLGGIANLSLLPAKTRQEAGDPVLGFDTGPANALMDLWCERHGRGQFDQDGRWAASGRVNPELLSAMLQEPFFAQPAPKSTGRDLFDSAWLDRHLARLASHGALPPAEDVQASLAELTVKTVVDALKDHSPGCTELLICGGGSLNGHLLNRLRWLLPPSIGVRRTDTMGIPVDQVEALAFAWLARERRARRPGNLPAVTGAAGTRILGAEYAGRSAHSN